MKNLKVWQKLVLMGAVFMLPFAAVATKLFSSISLQGVQFAEQENRGLDYYTSLDKLLRGLQRHRDLSAAVLSGDVSFRDAVARTAAEVETHIKSIDAVDTELNAALSTSKRWTVVRAASRDVINLPATTSVEDSFARHTAAIEEAISLISAVGDSSGLMLDSSIDSYYLANFLILKGPELTEVLSQARGQGMALVASGKVTPDRPAQLARAATLSTFLQRRLDKSLAKAFAFNSALKVDFEGEAHASALAVQQASTHFTRVAADGRVPGGATAFYAATTREIDSLFSAKEHATVALRGLLTNRIANYRSEMYATFLWTGLGLIGVLLVGLLIFRDITSALRKVVVTADRIALGDLTVMVQETKRRDEVGDLARAFDGMVTGMKDVANTAERIAGGDLAAKVVPRSDRDVLGRALENMIDRLSTLVGEVQRSGIQVNTSVNEIAATSRQQEATAREIAATTTQIGATSREISATSKELARTMGEVVSVADESAALAGSGQAGLIRMEDTMRQVMEAASSINAKLSVLNQKAGSINQVVTTITKVADQTNLLSLNAAIEAEKAGEYGRGFAVVATEIRRLADQTAVATYDIELMVKEIQSAVSAGVMGMDKFAEEVKRGMQDVQQVGGQLSQIIEHVQTLVPRFDAVNEGMQAQATGAEQITQALAQLSESAQQTVASLAQANEVIDGLNQAAAGMRTGVSRFKVIAA